MAKREVTAWDNILSPAGFFSGLVLSFLSCCVAGFILRNQNCYEAVERFHRFINIETLFYPTACQLRALGRSRLDPEKIAVVVGGNSILYGTSQRDEAVWTRRLQELLGQQYQVINLGTPGALPGEFGGVAAEILARDYPRLIFFTDQQPAAPAGDPDGHLYRYLFWDAYYKGLLQSDSLREERLLQLGDSRTAREKLVELKLQMVQDSYLSFRDLW